MRPGEILFSEELGSGLIHQDGNMGMGAQDGGGNLGGDGAGNGLEDGLGLIFAHGDQHDFLGGHNAADAIKEVEAEHPGRSIAHYDMRFVKPLDERLLQDIATRYKYIVTLEDGARNGGFGSAVLEWMSDHGYSPRITRLGLPDNFVEHGKVEELQRIVGIDKDGIKKTLI